MSRVFLTNRKVEAIRRDYAAGSDIYTVAVWHEVSPSTVGRYTRDLRRQHGSKIDMGVLSEMLGRGETKAAIARHFKCTWAAVNEAAKRLGVAGPGRTTLLNDQQIADIRNLYARGERQKALAIRFGVSQGTIQRRVADVFRRAA